jgi:transposase-like protein
MMDGVDANSEGRPMADSGKRIRRLWTANDKRRIVREAERPGAVRQQVAQRHGVHVSVLNRWRAELRQEERPHGAVIAGAGSQIAAITSGKSAGPHHDCGPRE